MTEQEFYNLRIGQEIYYKNKKVIINFLWLLDDNQKRIDIVDFENKQVIRGIGSWEDICADCSLEAQKPKRKFYLWAIKSSHGESACLIVSNILLTEDGLQANGRKYNESWDKLEKKKVGDFCWEE